MAGTVVLLLTHRWNRLVQSKFERLRREVGARAEALLLLQRSPEMLRALAEIGVENGTAVGFDPTGLPRALGFPYLAGGRLVPGSTHFPLLAFFAHRPDFDRYILIEHDVEFSGDWGTLVDEVANASCDFAASHVRSFEESQGWRWWTTLQAAEADRTWAVDKRNLLKSFNPVYCISRRGLEHVVAAHRKGWRGHYEILLATILARNGGTVTDLAEIGDFYAGSIQTPPRPDALVPGMSTMRWRPDVTPEEFTARSTGRTLFHPVKGRWTFDGERVRTFPAGTGEVAER